MIRQPEKDKIRLMHVIIGNGFGGLEKVVEDLIKGADKSQFEIFLLCLQEPHLLREKFESTGAKVISLGVGRGLKLGLPAKIRQILIDNEIDIVHCHDFNPFFYSGLATLGLKSCKKVYTEHSSVFSLSQRHFLAIRLLARVYDLMVMVSEDLLNFYRQNLSLENNKIVVVHNGVDFSSIVLPNHSAALRQDLDVNDRFIVGTAVRLMEQKGLQFLIDALPAIIQSNRDVLLIIIGEGRLKEELELQVEELGVSDHVRFLGYRNDISALLSIIDIYVLPSLWEGLPLGLIEAMLAKKPIVATRVGGVPELIIDGNNGRLVSPSSSTELATAVQDLMADPGKMKIYGEKAAVRAKQEFSLEAMIKNYQDHYNALMS